MSGLLIAFILGTGVHSVGADDKKRTAEEVLSLVDDNLLKLEDSTYRADVSVVRSNKVVKTMKFEAILKGLFKKRIKFTAPGDIAGIAIVTTEENVTYVYMPAYGKVRRVASHVHNQGFMGTDISGEEIGSAALSRGWKGTILKENDSSWILKLLPDKDNETTYSKMIVSVSKKYGGVDKIDSYNADGKKVKTQLRSEWQTFTDKKRNLSVTMPTVYKYIDHLSGSKTILTFRDCKVNQNVPDSIFTRRALMRGI